MMALVRGVITAATWFTFMFQMSGSLSTTTGLASARTTAAAQEMIVNDGRMTSSPGPNPKGGNGHLQSNGSIYHGDAVVAAEPRGELLLEPLDKWAFGRNPACLDALGQIFLLVAVEQRLVDRYEDAGHATRGFLHQVRAPPQVRAEGGGTA